MKRNRMRKRFLYTSLQTHILESCFLSLLTYQLYYVLIYVVLIYREQNQHVHNVDFQQEN